MKKLLCIVLLAVSMLGHSGYLSGAFLFDGMRAEDRTKRPNPTTIDYQLGAHYKGFVAGVADIATAEKLICPPPTTSVGQISRTVTTYLKDNPEKELDNSGYTIVLDALKDEFPCK